MTHQGKILVVDDTPQNVKLLADLLTVKGYEVVTARSGEEALAKVEKDNPDLILLDVVMPGMSGYDVCRKIRENQFTYIPIVMVTALDPGEERIKGLEVGGDDFLTQPIHKPELLARVRSLLRIKELYNTVQSQAAQLGEWNKTLEQRVQEQVIELNRLARLKRFFAPQLVDLIVSGETKDPLKTHRQDITVVFVDLRGFTSFVETAEPEEAMGVLREYHAELGRLIMQHEGTLERFTGDGLMVIFNDPVPIENPAERAVRMTLAVRERISALRRNWVKAGFNLDFGMGMASGYATIGAIGFEERWDYAAIGTVTNLAARLCGEAKPGQILMSQRLFSKVEDLVETEPLGELTLKGFHRPVAAYNLLKLKS